MSNQVKLLEESFAQLRPQLDEFGSSFYTNLFKSYPEAKPLFANTNMLLQQEKLVMSLTFVIDNLRNPVAVQETLHALGARHVSYGTVDEHYPLVGNVLLTTLAEYLGERWNPELEEAWSDAYQAITKLMLEGARP